MKVLIIDDTKSIHTFVKILLQGRSQSSTNSVFNGSEAIELLKIDRDYDLILLDWEMPIMNGPETLTKLQEISNTIPIIMMTTKNDPSDISLALNLGAKEYLMKPFTQDILFEKIDAIVDEVSRYVA